ncbi:hypothetical protein LRS06_22115 [Hymenobacter sp. J193]|uniref:hypothetical protein n=1 Tax=Hymenobacter sp. J193 TaxID=2898429 RepID=UPI0021516713|nr:hypothetical protein [Hymenobacter sp. J193]MCR5890426.1 hypothetical protein [Hymenobacter sp. J193]
MKLSFNPDTLLPNALPASMPAWAKQMPPLVPQARSLYNLALVRRQQQLLRQLSATLDAQGTPAFLIDHLDSVADLLGELVTPYLEKLDTLGECATEEIEPNWLPDFSPLPIFWRPSDPAVEVSSETVEAFDLVARQPDVVIAVSGGAAEVVSTRPGVQVEIVDFDDLGQEQGQARVQELLGGILDPTDWIPEYPQEEVAQAED